MSEKVQNTFNEGLNLDTPNYQTPNTVYTYAENITFVTHEGNELILQNEKGTTYKTSLKQNYIPIACKSYGSIAYIISAEVIDNHLTGRGEVGSFPSPDYLNKTAFDCTSQGCNYKGKLIEEYAPFQNYGGDDNSPINSLVETGYGEFNSINFNFQSDKPVEIVAIQSSYDGSVNVIFTDDFNKPKLINSRFSVLPGNRYEIINRTGSKDTNLYVEGNFKNTLNHIFTSNRLVHVSFDGQLNGGNLPTGQYKYYFQYATADGNVTNFIAESFNIPVFFGDSVATTKGGIQNQNTDKINVLRLSNLDTFYSAIKVFYTYSTGTVGADAQVQAFEVENELAISGAEVTFTHTGFESVQEVALEELSLDTASIDTYRTGTEVKGRLAIANITTKEFNSDLLRDFAKRIRIHQGSTRMVIPGVDTDVNHESIYADLSYDTKQLDTFEGAYYNPRNVHDYLGYWGGEAYMFGCVFLFNDGSQSPVYPIRGIDNLNGSAAYTNQDFIDSDYDDVTGENVRGIYRFPLRNKRIYLLNNYVNIFHAEFEVPPITPGLEEEDVVGIKFYRSRRKIDCIGQGMLMDTLILPVTASLIEFDKLCEVYGNVGYTEGNSKYVPAYNYLFDTAGRVGRNDDENYIAFGTQTRTEDTGIEVMRQTHANYQSDDLSYYYKRKFAFISPDFICNPVNNRRLYSSDTFSYLDIGNIVSTYAIPTNTPFAQTPAGTKIQNDGGWTPYSTVTNRSFSLIKQSGFVALNGAADTKSVKVEYVTGEVSSPTSEGFSSKTDLFVLGTNTLGKGIVFDDPPARIDDFRHYGLFFAKYNDYVGITTEESLNLGSSSITSQVLPGASSTYEGLHPIMLGGKEYKINFNGDYRSDALFLNSFNFTQGVVTKEATSKLINVYRGSGPRDVTLIKELYFPEYESYYAISQPYYFNSSLAEDATGVNGVVQTIDNVKNTLGRIVCYNGDCFTNLVHRRLYTSGLDREGTEYSPGFHGSNLGYSVAFVAESNYNVAGRYENIVAVNEGERSFYPHLAREHEPSTNQTSVKGEDNDWRIDRLPETKQYNTGYDNFETGRFKVALSSRLPFIQNNFSTRIWISESYVSSSFENQYRIFLPSSYEDYTQNLGEIVAIRNASGNIFCVHEFGCTLLPVDERIAQTGDSAGQVFFESTAVLPKASNASYISDLHGSQWQFSVTESDNFIYGVDMNTCKIWRMQKKGSGLELISDMKTQSFLRSIKEQYDNQNYQWFYKQIRTYYDSKHADLIFTFASSGDNCGSTTVENPPTCPTITYNSKNKVISISGGSPSTTEEIPNLCYEDGLRTLIFNELPTGKWKTFTSWYPINMFRIHDRVYSFPIQNSQNKLYEHFTGNYSTYYDTVHGFVIEVNVTNSTMLHQIYDNIMMICNHVYPNRIEYTTDEGTFVQTVYPQSIVASGQKGFEEEPVNSIALYNAQYNEDHMYIQVIKDTADLYQAFEQADNRAIRDKYCKIRIFYDTDQHTYIQALITSVTRSSI